MKSRRDPLSLRARMLLAGGLWAFVALLSVFAVLGLAISASLERTFERQLSLDVDALIAAISKEDGEPVTLAREPANPLFTKPYSGWYWQVSFDGGKIRSRSLWDETLETGEHIRLEGELHVHRTLGPNGESLQIVERDVSLPGVESPVHIKVAADRSDLVTERGRLLSFLALSLAALGLWLLIAAAVQATFVMTPLKSLRLRLEDMRSSPEKRLPERQPAELAPLVRALNAVLDHDADLITKARAHVGNLAHGLKTPISILQAASEDGAPIDAETARAELAVMRRLVERHLARARSVTGSAGARGLRVSVLEIARRLKAPLLALHGRDLRLEFNVGHDARFAGDPDDLMEILGNLMDNACKWAGRAVRVSARSTVGGVLELRIEDDGPGLSETSGPIALARGARLDDRTPGHGLGLDIVRDLVALYGGTIRLERSADLGGLKVLLRFGSDGGTGLDAA